MGAQQIIRVFDQVLSADPHDVLPVQVIRVITDELATDRPLIADIITGLNGITVDLANLGVTGVTGILDGRPELQAAVSELLAPALPPGAVLSWQETDGLVLASFAPIATAENESIQTLLGAAVCLFDARLYATETVAVVWDDSALDLESAQAVWRILTELVEGRAFGRLGRLFLFAGGDVRYSLHLDGLRPARFLLHRSGIDLVKDPTHLFERVEFLAQAHRDGLPLVLFLGAGFSWSSGPPDHRIPLGDTLRDEALVAMLGEEGTQRSRLHQFYALVRENDLWTPAERTAARLPDQDEFCEFLTLERVLLVQFATMDGPQRSPTLRRVFECNEHAVAAPGVAVRRLHDLFRRRQDIVVVTVNFDTLVESAAGVAFEVLATPADLQRATEVVRRYLGQRDERSGSSARPVPVIKLHGTIGDFDSVVADVGRVAEGLSEEVKDALAELALPEMPVPWVYIGHSMRDADLIKVIEQRHFALGTNEMWVSPSLPHPVRRFAGDHREQLWLSHGRNSIQMRHVTVTADRFLAELLARWPND